MKPEIQTITAKMPVSRSSLADIETSLEASAFHLKSMLDLTWEKLDDIGGEGYSVDQAVADSGLAQSLIHAAKKYLSDVTAAKDRL